MGAGLGIEGELIVGARGRATDGGEAVAGGELEAQETRIMLIDVNLDQPTSDQRVTAGAQGRRLSMSVSPPEAQSKMWWNSRNREWSQPGIAQR